MLMEERIPEQVFNRPPLAESPVRIPQPDRQAVINVYNAVFARLMLRRSALETRYSNGEFNTLPDVAAKVRNGEELTNEEQQLVADYGTLVDAQIAYLGRRNLNTASLVFQINQQEANGTALNAVQREIREIYQAGDFHLINDEDHPLREDISVDKYTQPARDGDEEFAIIDGAPVDGLIRFVDQEILGLPQRRDLSTAERQRLLGTLRYQRNVLFTQSSSIFSNEDSVFHARNQLEAYYNFIDPLRSEAILPDWFNGEQILRERRVLNIPTRIHERTRWAPGCLPFIIIPLLIPFCGGITTSPCYGTGGNLHLEVFTPDEAKGIYITGANERQMAYVRLGIPQNQYLPDNNPRLRAEVDRIRSEEPNYYGAYVETANGDYSQTARRIRGDGDDSPWITQASDFSPRQVLSSCLSPEQRHQRVMETLERQNNPQWWHPVADFATWVRDLVPTWSLTIR